MNELVKALTADSAHASPAFILEGLTDAIVNNKIPNTPHTIYQELYHINFWQQVSLDWATGKETTYPLHPEYGFGTPTTDISNSLESLPDLIARFHQTNRAAALLAADPPPSPKSFSVPHLPANPPAK
jgi:DinB superfamily